MIQTTQHILIKPIAFNGPTFEHLKSVLSALPWSIYLQSEDTKHCDSHWSIFSCDPIATFLTQQGISTIVQADNKTSSAGDPFKQLNLLRKSLFKHNEVLPDFPFSGGALGSINYELGYQIESLRGVDNTPTLDIPDMQFGFYDWAILQNTQTQHLFLLVNNNISALPLEQMWQNRHDWLINKIQSKTKAISFKLTQQWAANMDKQTYIKKFERVHQYILSGDCYQVNLAQRFQATYQGDEYQAYTQLLTQNRPPFGAFLRYPTHCILSLSPERFLRLQGQHIQTKPIKGTRPRYKDKAQDEASRQALQSASKDRAENLMIVDLLRNDIGKVSDPGTVKVPKLFDIESFPAVHHLVSTVEGTLSAQHCTEDLLRSCFPGGSITGAPKIRAMQIIAELEPSRREIYCGSIGYINANGDMDMNIAIRTLLCHQQSIYCWAGGGLVADSKALDEYQECLDKIAKILPILTRMDGSED
ncbi:para-aminobenzoate synthase subunit I [Psychromonas sp. CNPT3]|uniref:aminodeoxychorismate synthase component I n=1 Tax=Psychromonas sp. CNPT3 TaxID=314282 RepID=UPI00006E9A4A|nr:aminodeoxychorismate synthase component I [Psychromonas sp. CNPT3]AGH81132.1 para-aminobenzoate synthase subunit I [Psychromonas sp. CNPT3]